MRPDDRGGRLTVLTAEGEQRDSNPRPRVAIEVVIESASATTTTTFEESARQGLRERQSDQHAGVAIPQEGAKSLGRLVDDSSQGCGTPRGGASYESLNSSPPERSGNAAVIQKTAAGLPKERSSAATRGPTSV
jgi:hypothetical protein